MKTETRRAIKVNRFSTLPGMCLAIVMLLFAFPAAAASPDREQFPRPTDHVDQAVEAFSLASAVLGVQPGPAEKQLVAAIVRCALANTSILNCARMEAVAKLPGQWRPIADCMIRGANTSEQLPVLR